jgi:hypothetical protein
MNLNAGIAWWEIRDSGSEFEVGCTYEFALLLRGWEPGSAARCVPSLELVDGCVYDVVGEVIYTGPDVCVLDTGIHCYSGVLSDVAVGDFVAGRAYLGVHPYETDSFRHRRGLPASVYRWHLDGIALEATHSTVSERGHDVRVLGRDETGGSYLPVFHTDARHDDNGSAHYIFNCRLVGDL